MNYSFNKTALRVLSEDDLKSENLFKQIHLICIYCIAIPGTILNVITASIFLFRKFFWENGNTMGIMYTLQATVSAFPLLTEILTTLIDSKFYFNNDDIIRAKIIRFFKIYTLITSLLIQLLITAERWIKLKYTFQHLVIFKIRNILLITLLILIFASFLSFFQLLSDTFVKVPFLFRGKIVLRTVILLNPIFNGISIVIYRTVPLILMLSFNILILKKVSIISNLIQDPEERMKYYRSVVILIALNFLYFILSIPFFVLVTKNSMSNKDKVKTLFYLRLTSWFVLLYEALTFVFQIIFNIYFRIEFKRTVILLFKLYLK
jgi:hypothetical protein